MSLVWFKQIRSAFRPEADVTDKYDKCAQLRFFIAQFFSMLGWKQKYTSSKMQVYWIIWGYITIFISNWIMQFSK